MGGPPEDESHVEGWRPPVNHGERLLPATKDLIAEGHQLIADLREIAASIKPTIDTINRLVARLDRLFPEELA